MKLFLSILLLLTSTLPMNPKINQNNTAELKPCPNSPNCVSTQEARKRKKMDPIAFTVSPDAAIQKLEQVIATYSNATLVTKKDNYLHYTFKTKLFKFIDDVEFIIDREEKVIHFRSASRKGYSDFGKNKRRMKKIRKEVEANNY